MLDQVQVEEVGGTVCSFSLLQFLNTVKHLKMQAQLGLFDSSLVVSACECDGWHQVTWE